jgi:hypothetical protein
MWPKKLQMPRWRKGLNNSKDWEGRAKGFRASLFAVFDPRLEESAGDDGVAWLNGLRGFAAFLVRQHTKHLLNEEG